MKKTIVFMLTGLLILSLAIAVIAKPNQKSRGEKQGFNRDRTHDFGMGRGGRGMKMFGLIQDRLLKELNLNEKQKQEIDKIKEESQIKGIRLEADIKIAEIKLKNLMQKDKVNKTEVNKAIDELFSQKAEVMKSNINCMVDIKNVLTDEQLKKLDELKKERFKNRGKRNFGKKKTKRGNNQGKEYGKKWDRDDDARGEHHGGPRWEE